MRGNELIPALTVGRLSDSLYWAVVAAWDTPRVDHTVTNNVMRTRLGFWQETQRIVAIGYDNG